MPKLTVTEVKTPLETGMVRTARYNLDAVALGMYQDVNPANLYASPMTPLEGAMCFDVAPSQRCVMLSPPFVKMALAAGLTQHHLHAAIFPALEALLHQMDGVRHVPVLNEPLLRIKQYELESDTFTQALRQLHSFVAPDECS